MDTQAIEIPKQLEAYLPPIESEYDNKDELASSLDVLAQVVNILEIPDASFFNPFLEQLFTSDHENEQRKYGPITLARPIESRRRRAEGHLASLKHETQLLVHWNEVLTPGHPTSLLPETAATLERRKEALIKKAKEYHRELEMLTTEEPLIVPVTLAQLMEQKEKNLAKQRELKEKRAKLKTFQGLPPNLDLARHELRTARQRQTELIQLRERLLARMADSVS